MKKKMDNDDTSRKIKMISEGYHDKLSYHRLKKKTENDYWLHDEVKKSSYDRSFTNFTTPCDNKYQDDFDMNSIKSRCLSGFCIEPRKFQKVDQRPSPCFAAQEVELGYIRRILNHKNADDKYTELCSLAGFIN